MPIDPQDGGLDDWFVPASDGYPDDWFVPASATPATAQPAPGPQPGAANLVPATRALPRPDPLTAFLSLIPASRWVTPPPIFPDAFGRYPLPPVPPPSVPRIDPTLGLFGGLANRSADSSAPTYGLFGTLKYPSSEEAAAFPSFQEAEAASGNSNRYAPPSLFSGLANLPGSTSPTETDGLVGAGNYIVGSDRAGQLPFPNRMPFGAQPFNISPSLSTPPFDSQPANTDEFPLLRSAGLTTGNNDRSVPQSPLKDSSDLYQAPKSNAPGDVEDNSGGNSSEAPAADPDESHSTTRVVRDSTGRALAIIHVQPAPTDAPSSKSDATPDALRAGSQHAQINNAITGRPIIDRTTDTLLAVLQASVLAMGPGSGARFGTAVHVDFANRVRKLDLPGIGQDGVEQGFHFDIKDFIHYGLDGSIRTDVTLRDPKDPYQRPIAVYDLKTGYAVLTPGRVGEILKHVDTPGVLVIELQYRTGDAIDRTRSARPR